MLESRNGMLESRMECQKVVLLSTFWIQSKKWKVDLKKWKVRMESQKVDFGKLTC